MRKQTHHVVAWINLSVILLAGCSGFGSKPHNRLPNDGPTTQEAYEDHLAAAQQSNPRTAQGFTAQRAALNHETDPSAWTRDTHNELSLRFPRIPNPELMGYVFPHLSGQRHPVPGYTTQFPLYEAVHYALPGEAPPTPHPPSPPAHGPAAGSVHE